MYFCGFVTQISILMRILKKNLLLLLFAGFLLRGTAQNVTLVVTMTNGTEHSYQLTNEGQLLFENNGEALTILDGTGTTATFQLADIRKLVCTEITEVSEDSLKGLQLLPNPARDHFLINKLQNEGEARLYSLDGRLMKSFIATEGMMVDISDLAPGMYLLHIDGQTLKMMKL